MEPAAASLRHDYFDPLVWNERNNKLVSGHLRKKVLIDLGVESADMVKVSYDEATHRARVIAANEQAGAWDDTKLRVFLEQMVGGLIPAELSGLTDERIKALLADSSTDDGKPSVSLKLWERFGVPPFSILDARQGYWQDRKRAWLALGIQSEVGRGDNLLKFSDTVLQPDKGKRLAKTFGTEGNVAGDWTGTSIFDPVLCELAYRWFCGADGEILDPFSGGSVRGIVAAWLGRNYTGIDLRREQVVANREQWAAIRELSKAPVKFDARNHQARSADARRRVAEATTSSATTISNTAGPTVAKSGQCSGCWSVPKGWSLRATAHRPSFLAPQRWPKPWACPAASTRPAARRQTA
jgi:hypothetical protein